MISAVWVALHDQQSWMIKLECGRSLRLLVAQRRQMQHLSVAAAMHC
jgi:hypothetical protein